MIGIQISLLGAAHVSVAGKALRIARRQPLVLLAYLALADSVVTRDHLAYLFWPDAPRDVARQRLRRTIGQLREHFQSSGAASPMQIQGERISIDRALCSVDVWEFQRLASGGTAATAATIARCEAADALYGGSFLAGIDVADTPELEHWLLQIREGLSASHHRCLSALSDGYTEEGQFARAIAVAERLLGFDPLREETHRALMRLYAAEGQRAQALRQYERCVATLADDLGVEPLAETRALYEMLLRDERPATVRPTPSLSPWPIRPSLPAPCLGRDAEIGAVVESLRQGLRGQPTIACVSGPAGIGKTRLIQEALRAFELPVWLSVGQPAGQSVPYGAIVPALRGAIVNAPLPASLPDLWLAEVSRVLPEVRMLRPDLRPPANLPPDQAQVRLFEALTQLVGALSRRSGGAILVIDNLDEADNISLAWLANLLRDSTGMPLGLVVAFRPPPDRSPLHNWLDHLVRGGDRRDINPLPLALDTAAELIRLLVRPAQGLSERLWLETGGNPFFLLETLRLIVEQGLEVTAAEEAGRPLPLPATVQEVILARLRALGQLPRQIIDAAAILAPSFDGELVRAVSGRDEMEAAEALDALVAASLLSESGADYRFAHAQIVDVVYADIGTARRRVLHRRAVETLRRHQEVSGAVLAHHLERAGDLTAAAAAWLEAAGQSASVFAADEALASLARGLALVTDPEQRYELLMVQEDLFEHLGRRAEQATTLDSLERLAGRLGPAYLPTVHFRRGRLSSALGLWGEAETQLHQALDGGGAKADVMMLLARVLTEQQRWDEAEAAGKRALQDAGDARTRSRALHTLAQLARTREDRATLETVLQQALAITPDTDPLRARLLLDLGEVHFRQGKHEDSLVVTTDALRLAQAQASRATEALAHNQLGNCFTRLNRNGEALDAFRRAAEAHRLIENRPGEAAAIGNLGVLAMRMGLLDESIASMEQAYALFEELGNVPGLCLAANNLGTALIWLDRSAGAVPHLRLALERAIAAALPIREAATRCNLGAALLDIGHVDEGVALMERGAAMRGELQYGDLCIDHACLAVAYLRCGRIADADRLSAQALAELAQVDNGVAHPQRIAFARAQVLHTLGRNGAAEEALAQAQEQLDRYAAQFATADERARYLTAFVFNRNLQAARLGRWPDPPHLV